MVIDDDPLYIVDLGCAYDIPTWSKTNCVSFLARLVRFEGQLIDPTRSLTIKQVHRV